MLLRLIILLLFIANISSAQSERQYARKGNNAYNKEKYTDAEAKYRKSLEENSTFYEGSFNLGDALYKQKKYEEAGTYYKITAEQAKNKIAKAKAYHNLGNSLLETKKIKESIEAYKNALRNNPNDHDTKYNLAYAQSLLKQQQQKQDQQNDRQQKNDQEKQKEQDKQQQDQQNAKQEEQKEQQQKQKPKEGQLSKKDAERLLEALKNEEQKVQDKLKKKKLKASKVYIEKDW